MRLIFILKKVIEGVYIRTANIIPTYVISQVYVLFFLDHSVPSKSARSQGTRKVLCFVLSPEQNLAFCF